MRPASRYVTKVAIVTPAFWVAKIAATTLGETGGDTVTLTLNLGYPRGAEGLFVVLILLVAAQVSVKEFRPLLFWATIVASTMFGTAMADVIDRSLRFGFGGGTLLLFGLLIGTLCLWYAIYGSISIETVSKPGPELFYWTAVTLSQTLGTALGDWLAARVGYEGAAFLFGGTLAVIAACYLWTSISRVALFWAAFILTRPLGATVGDFLDKPRLEGGLAVSQALISLLLAVFILACIFLLPTRPGTRSPSPR